MMQDSKGNILYVEDREDSRYMISFLLERAGFQVTAVPSMVDAWRLTDQRQFDLYLLDRGLSDGSSLTLCEHLRKTCPQSPVVFCTGAADWDDKQAALQAGANAYITKPFALTELLQTVQGLLKV